MSTDVAVNGTLVVNVEVPTDDSNPLAEIVAGYTLQERIGAGGYGEVWRAIGPGGLPKAVKVLHGNYDGVAAETELQALELMRELRHPFLLNVERIEVIGNRLVIVTELADQSLEERFDELVDGGSKGIPRDELIKYMQEAADALDFMSGRHGLQHLDIKPSNLLLQGSHLKVADFGLIKNVNQTNVSMIAGFTPLYAPPELFDGRPSTSSDQYSLAIVYQVMLTGVPPFGGRTAAQLTAQHLSSKPDLSMLPHSDNAAVSRALSKNPSARFPTCREFVERLSQRRSANARQRTTPSSEPRPPKSVGVSVASPDQRTDPVAPRIAPVALPAIDPEATETDYRPTLFLGLGGLAGEVLCRLRQRLCSRFGGDKPPAAFPCLFVDTNSRATSAARNRQPGPGLSDGETLDVPLRDRDHYRRVSGEMLEWLSRRWLYNIPRSGQVEGLRPLGRLAFVDHQEEIRDRLQQCLGAATTTEAVEDAGRRLGRPVNGTAMDVVVIASLSGGTGSGMVLDAGYLVRDVAESLGIELGDVTGVLMQATGRQGQAEDLGKANAISCLRELAVFSAPETGYPGDPACRLPRSDVPPFDHPYVVHLGHGLSGTDLDEQVERIAEYLDHNTLTSARTFFAQCRRDSDSTAPGRVRTFGLALLEDFAEREDHRQAEELCLGLLRLCCERLETDGSPSGGEAREYVAKLLNDLQLDTDTLLEIAVSIFRGELGDRVGNYFRGKLAALLPPGTDHAQMMATCHNEIEQEFCITPTDQTPEDHPARILAIFQQQLSASAESTVSRLHKGILRTCSDSQWNWTSACESVAEVLRQLGETEDGLASLFAEFEGDRTTLHAGAALTGGSAESSSPDLSDPLSGPVQHAMHRFCGYVTRSLIQHVHNVSAAVRETAGAFRAELQEVETAFRQAQVVVAAASARDSQPESPDFNAVGGPDASTVQEFERWLCRAGTLRLADLVTKSVPQESVVTFLFGAALSCVLDHAVTSDPARTDRVAASIEPKLTGVGGGRRILAVLPESANRSAWVQPIESRFGDCVTVVDTGHSDQLLCCEVQDIDLGRAVGSLTGQSDRLAEVASRIHTRIDVDWD